MSRKLLQLVIGSTSVILLLVGCRGSAPSAVSEAPMATSAPEQPIATPTPVLPTPTELPTATPTSEPPTATPTTVPTPLPSGIEKLAIGTDFNNEKDCEITKPLLVPIKFPAGTTHFAYQVVIDPAKATGVEAIYLRGPLSGETTSKNCDKHVVVAGAPRQSQWGATISSLKGDALKSGTYDLIIVVNRQMIRVPFEIE
jgi:hypothetical protein